MKKKLFFNGTILWALVLMLVCLMEKPVSAQSCIPEGANIYSATFSVFVRIISDDGEQEVQLHRVNAPWVEGTVTWNNFAASFDDGAVEDSFTAGPGRQDADLTPLVQAWVDGSYPNYGVLLKQGQTHATIYKSSEHDDISDRPQLEICYFLTGDPVSCFTVKRSGDEQDGVADSYIWALHPDQNRGNSILLYTGLINEYEKQSLVRFEIETCQEPGPGTGTPGYWKNHPEAWPVEGITIGEVTYTKTDAIRTLKTPERGDKTYTMFRGLVAAKLNVEIGNIDTCIANTIDLADSWMGTYGPAGSKVRANSQAWDEGEPLYLLLDQYNNGELCASHRD